MVFSDRYISDTDAESQMAYVPSSSSAGLNPAEATPKTLSESSSNTELSSRQHKHKATTNDNSDHFFLLEAKGIYEKMILDSLPYLCSIPQAEPQKNETPPTTSAADEEKELARATFRGEELLKDMEGHCMYFMSGWWSYSFCYNSEVKQFHQMPPLKGGVPAYPPVEDDRTPSFVLGQFEVKSQQTRQVEGNSRKTQRAHEHIETGLAHIQTKGDMRYMVQKLTGGTICDITGRPRKIEVQFHCHPQSADRIAYIKEVATCSYLMVIYTPRLCNDVAFLPPKETKAHQVVCREIVRDDGLQTWRSRKAAETARLLEMAGSAETPTRPMVGGIEVGGMKQVGTQNRRIEPPKVFDPADKGDIVAKWDPNENGGKVQMLSNAKLREMELIPSTVHAMREELQKMARGRPWKLEVVDQANGDRELRGIVEEDEDAPASKDGKPQEKADKKKPQDQPAKDRGEDLPPAAPPRGNDKVPELPEDYMEDGELADERDYLDDRGEEGSEEIFKDEL